MLKIGLLVGQERSFPDALMQEINSSSDDITAEYVSIGEVHSEDPREYEIILDRISHEVPFYQAFLKRAALSGTTVINNPFWRLADDKFFGTALIQKMGIAVPKTLILPSRSYPESILPESLRNLKHPLDWQAIVSYTGLPAILKPHWGGGWKDVHRIDSLQQLLDVYNTTGSLCMMLQEFIDWQQYTRCICVGKKNVLVTSWDPRKPHFERYRGVEQNLSQDLRDKIESQAILINEALGYDMNTVEFAIRDGIPYAIDFMNSAPDFDISSLTENYFRWVVKAMADMLIARARENSARKHATKWHEFIHPL